jgi:cytochrome c-type biogenesis protein CcmE
MPIRLKWVWGMMMKYLAVRRSRAQFNLLAVAGTMVFAGIAGTPCQVVAAPGDYIPSSESRDWEDGDARWGNSRQVDVTGVVTTRIDNNRTFEIRSASDNKIYRVRARNNSGVRNLSVGDEVRVSGRLRNNETPNDVIRATDVQIVRDNGSSDADRVQFNGTVERIISAQRFTVLRDGFRQVYTVNINRDIRNLIRPGDRISVEGTTERNRTVQAIDIDKIDDSETDENGSDINFVGTVERINSARNFTIRRDSNRQIYTVDIERDIRNVIRVGDRISVDGTLERNRRIRATDIDKVEVGDDNSGGYGQRVEFNGTVERIESARSFTVRRDGNRQLYRVDIERDIINLIRVGDRISVDGTLLRNQRIRATDIDKIGGPGNDGSETGNLNFEGRVTQVYDRKHVEVRGNNGRVYDVRTWALISGDVNIGDVVRVAGAADGAGRINGATVALVRNGDGSSNNNGQQIQFRGTVLGDTRTNTNFSVRADNGRTYTVRYGRGTFKSGQRVSVVGEYDGNVVVATDINKM